ncbi:MAG: hypothetical protein LBV32_06670 [Tannerellaceae bacterium]|jgi:hypothetical protein|nr:hypothetical protein [Tannerellaceae bacterium]
MKTKLAKEKKVVRELTEKEASSIYGGTIKISCENGKIIITYEKDTKQ